MHRTLENDRMRNTRVAQRVYRFFILGGMWTGSRVENRPSKSKLTPLVDQINDNEKKQCEADPFGALVISVPANEERNEMAFVLENITPEDQQKILEDALADPTKYKQLIHAKNCNEFPRAWAIDRQRGYYILGIPKLVRDEGYWTCYYAYVDGRMYQIKKEMPFGHGIYFDEEALPSPHALIEIQEIVKDALTIYGVWGMGPLDTFGNHADPFKPEFVSKKGA